jgi:hypothetical protein
MKKIVFAVLCITQLFLVNSATANHLHVFPLWTDSDESTINNRLVLQDGDLVLTITAWKSSYGNNNNQRRDWRPVRGDDLGVYQADDGLGVVSSEQDGNDLDGGRHRDRATDPDEGLLFEFSHYVELVDLFIGDVSRNDDINFSEVTSRTRNRLTLGKTLFDQTSDDRGSEKVFEFDTSFTGTSFLLWVDGRSDDVEVLGIAVVPEPTPILLFALGLLGLGLRKRK